MANNVVVNKNIHRRVSAGVGQSRLVLPQFLLFSPINKHVEVQPWTTAGTTYDYKVTDQYHEHADRFKQLPRASQRRNRLRHLPA